MSLEKVRVARDERMRVRGETGFQKLHPSLNFVVAASPRKKSEHGSTLTNED